MAPLPDFEYQLKVERVQLGGIPLEVECLENLDTTIDQLFDHLARGGNPALLEELCPYFGVIWPSAQALSELIVQEFREKFFGARVLEVGCGLAIPSMVATKLGAVATAADFHPEVPRFLARNLSRNGIKGLRYESLDWTKESGDLGKFDFVIGSDILYEKEHAEGVARAMETLLAPGGTGIVADPARPYLQEFLDRLRAFGFQVNTEVRRAGLKEIFLLQFTKQK